MRAEDEVNKLLSGGESGKTGSPEDAASSRLQMENYVGANCIPYPLT